MMCYVCSKLQAHCNEFDLIFFSSFPSTVTKCSEINDICNTCTHKVQTENSPDYNFARLFFSRFLLDILLVAWNLYFKSMNNIKITIPYAYTFMISEIW